MFLPARQAEPSRYCLRARTDLLNGTVCAASVRCSPSLDASFQPFLDQVLLASARWRRIGADLPIHIALPFAQITQPEHAAHLDASLAGNGFSPTNSQLEIDECAFALGKGVFTALEKLRGRGWQLGLRSSDRPSLALDARTRNLFGTLVVASCEPANGADGAQEDALFARIDAAKAAGWAVVLQNLPRDRTRAWLCAAGFDAYEKPLLS